MEVYRLPTWVKTDYDLELYHSGVKNMKWGKRLYQNKDGSLTPLGRIHYGVGTPRSEASALAKKAGQTTYNVARQTGAAAANTIERSRNAAARVDYAIDSNISPARRMSSFDTSSRRATNLGEVGTGVRRRASINGRHSINYNSDLDTINPTLTVKGKQILDSNSLRDSTMDSIREREITQIGRFYTEEFYKGIGGYGVSSRNDSDSGILANYYARQGRSQTGGESPYSYHKNTLDTLQTRNMQDNEYEVRKMWKDMRDRGASKAEIEKRQKEINDKYDKEWDEINKKYRRRRR